MLGKKIVLISIFFSSTASFSQGLSSADEFYRRGQYYQASRVAFQYLRSSDQRSRAYGSLIRSLVAGNFYQSASFFFLKGLQTRDTSVYREILPYTETLTQSVGMDVFSEYLLKYTKAQDYPDQSSRDVFSYFTGKRFLFSGKVNDAIFHLSRVSNQGVFWPRALLSRGTAYSFLGNFNAAEKDFNECVSRAVSTASGKSKTKSNYLRLLVEEARDLEARCRANLARIYYEKNEFDQSDREYDKILKASIVWPETLIEQAWNAFAKGEYNRTLGKLVSYKSPALQFVFNSGVEVLTAQSYLALCYYQDANEVIQEFQKKYNKIGRDLKNFIETSARRNQGAFFEVAKDALKKPRTTTNSVHHVMNRFIRGPYFMSLVESESLIDGERDAVRTFDRSGKGLSGFLLKEVLPWRKKMVSKLAISHVKDSLVDYYQELISDFEKISFIQLEMLRLAKEAILDPDSNSSSRLRGNQIPERKDRQYYWSFNGEFWNDEIGDYVFGLESKCRK